MWPRPATRIARAALVVLLTGCAGAAPAASSTPAAPTHVAPTSAATALALGDGHAGGVPAVGSIDSCQTQFGAGPGAQAAGPWIRSDGTWEPSAKVSVAGLVKWPQASYSMTLQGTVRTLRTNDLPVIGTTGTFPVAASDPAFAFDHNPNVIAPQDYTFTLPALPAPHDVPACLPLGPVGVLTNGVVLYDGLDGSGRDAVAHEVQDACGGHPDMSGSYHYHAVGQCVSAPAASRATLVGYALDGFGIYVEHDAAGRQPTNADLDVCHGRISEVPWDDQMTLMYHYVVTAAYPYTVGCFRGTGNGSAWHNH